MRTAAKKDANHNSITDVLNAYGITTHDVHQLKGFCDVICKRGFVNELVEIKDGSKPPSARKLTPDEISFHEKWGWQVHVIETEDQAIEFALWMKRKNTALKLGINITSGASEEFVYEQRG